MKQSIPSSSSSASASTPLLSDVVPWNTTAVDRHRHESESSTATSTTILVLDSIESDGRFVLYQHVCQVLQQQQQKHNRQKEGEGRGSSSSVLWLCGGPLTPKLIKQSLQKMGCCAEAATSASSSSFPSLLRRGNNDADADAIDNNNNNKKKQKLTIRSLTEELSQVIESNATNDDDDDNNNEENNDLNRELEIFVKGIYRQIKEWVVQLQDQNQQQSSWIILDDMSTFASLVGDRLTYALIQSLKALQLKTGFGLMIRCSNDYDQEIWKDIAVEGKDASRSLEWLGAGGERQICSSNNNSNDDGSSTIPFERSLVEMADYVVDVCPLLSGASREAHGRLVFTKMISASTATTTNNHQSTRSSAAAANSTQLVNYCLTDSTALAVRIRR